MKIIEYPNDILRKKTDRVINFNKELEDLVFSMFETLENADGLGLAAPQVGILKSIVVVGYKPSEDKKEKYPDLIEIPKTILINPEITWKSLETCLEKEGCLSFPNIEYDVPRAKKIHFEFYDLEGKRKKMKVKGLFARLVQHEIDHLYGKVIADYK